MGLSSHNTIKLATSLNMNDDASSSSSDSSQEGTSAATNGHRQEEQLATRFQLRLTASHLPKVSGKRLGALARKNPDSFATVTSIVRQEGTSPKQHPQQHSSDFRASRSKGRQTTAHQPLLSSFSSLPLAQDDQYMVEWGCTEVIHNSRSPQWIETIPLKYEYGSELFVYVRILQAETANSKRPGKSLSPNNNNNHKSNNSLCDDHSTTSLDASSTVFATSPQKNRMGHCFGTALFEVGDILGSRNYTKVKRLKSGGCVYARLEPENPNDEKKVLFRFQFQGINLVTSRKKRRIGFGSEPHTVLEISRPQISPTKHSWITIFRSRPILSSNNPLWDLSEIDFESCCPDEDMSQPIRLSIYRLKKGHTEKLVGVCETTVHNLIANVQDTSRENRGGVSTSEKDFFLQRSIHKLNQVGQLRVKVACLVTLAGHDLTNATTIPLSPMSSFEINATPPMTPISLTSLERTQSSDTVTSTTTTPEDPFNVDLRQLSKRYISVASPTTTATVTLNDFLDSGGQLEFCVAIDFTSSNGNPLQPGTLHFQSDDVYNDYEETITAVGNAINKYNSSSEYAVWGFGAKFGDGIVRHLFQCGQSATVRGVDGILNAYKSVFRCGGIFMSGPTVFVNAIQAAAVKARNYKLAGNLRYCVLLVVTDGIMDNFEETRQKLCIYNEVPLSVIFVGVGRTDFRSMYALCESSPNNTTFVEFRQRQHDPRSLAEASLRDLPRQISGYLARNRGNQP